MRLITASFLFCAICEFFFVSLEKDKNQKIFAFAYLPLMNNDGTALQDSCHDLAIYKVCIYNA